MLRAIEVEAKALQKQVLLARELGVEAGFIHPGGLLQFLQAGVGKAVLPEHRQGLFKHSLTAEISTARHFAILP